jgi:hypothetical protein
MWSNASITGRLIGLEPGSSSAWARSMRLTGALISFCALVACGGGRQTSLATPILSYNGSHPFPAVVGESIALTPAASGIVGHYTVTPSLPSGLSLDEQMGKNLLWVAKQHGHSVEVMRMYAAWLEGAMESDIHAIEHAMEKRPTARAVFFDSRAAISSINAATNRGAQIVIRPPKSPEFGSSLAVGKSGTPLNTGKGLENKWRRGWDSNPRAGITRPSDFESAPL